MPRVPVDPEDVNTPDPHDDPVESLTGMEYNDPDEPEEEFSLAAVVEPATAPTENLSTLELLLDEMVEESDAWGYANSILDRDTPTSMRMAFYPRWIAMVATKSVAERDMLINRGRQVFVGVTTETMRKAIEELVENGASRTQSTPSVITDEVIVEMVQTPDGLRYLIYKNDGTHEIQENVAIDDTIYSLPLVDSLVSSGTLLLPTGVEEYEDTAALHAEMVAFIRRYVKLKSDADVDLAAFYARYTWVSDRIPVAPYLHAIGHFERGKSRLLDVIGNLTHRGLIAAGSLTAAVMFRALDLAKATLIIDEADYDQRDPEWKQILKVLLVGSQKRRAVMRVDMDARGAVKTFDPFGPKILATRKDFPDEALSSRCLDFTMEHTLTDAERKALPKILPPTFDEEAQVLRNKLLLWRLRRVRHVTVDHYADLPGLSPRVTQAAIALTASTDDSSLGDLILDRLRKKTVDIQQSREQGEEDVVVAALLKFFDVAMQMKREKQERPPSLFVPLKKVMDQLDIDGAKEWENRGRDVSRILRALDLDYKRTNAGYGVDLTKAQAKALRSRYVVVVREPVKQS